MKLFTPAFIALSLANFFHVSSFSAYFIFPLILTAQGGNNTDIGIIMGVFAFASAFSRPWVATMVDRIGRKRSYACGTLIMTVMPLTHLLLDNNLSSDYPLLLLIRFLHGIGLAICFTSVMTFIVDLVPVNRLNEGVGIFGSSGLVAMAVGPLIGEFVLKTYGNKAFFICSSALVFCSFLLQIPLHDRRQTDAEGAEKAIDISFWGLLKRRKQMVCAGLGLVFGVGIAATSNFIAPLAEHRGLPLISAYYIAYSCAAVAVRFAAGRLTDRIGEQQVIPWGFVLAGGGMFLIPFINGQLMMITVGFIFGLGHGLLFPALNTMIVRDEPYAIRGKVVGIYTGSIDSGSFLGAFALGAIGQIAGFNALFCITGLVLLAGLAIFRFRP